MRILINDYAGHPFEVQLSRVLAGRGHEVLHTFCSSVQTPRGALARRPNDPSCFNVVPIALSRPFNKYGMVERFFQEKELGRLLAKKAEEFKPDVVISANTPLGAQSSLIEKCQNMKVKFIFWVQDLLGIGIKNNISKKLPWLGKFVGRYYVHVEETLLRKSDEVIVIAEDFGPIITKAGVPEDKIHVIHNWAPLDEIPRFAKQNPWSQQHKLDQKFCFLYSGTLGMKHNPRLLVELAMRFRSNHRVCVLVITEGLGAKYLEEKKAELGLENLMIMPFQLFEDLPMVLASADVLLAILESNAGVFSVPSKVLTYLCTERPLLLAVPPENLAARIVEENQAGIVVSPSDTGGFLNAAKRLAAQESLRATFAKNGLEYAQKTFDIEKITDKFEEIIYR